MSRRSTRGARNLSGSGAPAVPGYATRSGGSHLSTRPNNTTYGTSVTCYQNAFTAYTAVGGALPAACGEMVFYFRDGSATGVRSTTVRIGVDLAGGTTFTAIGDFLIGGAPTFNVGSGFTMLHLPLSYPAGATFGVAPSVNNATPGTLRCWFDTSEDASGTRVACTLAESVGLTPASSNGTAVTPGQAAEGAWVELGTLANDAKYFGVGADINNATMGSLIYHCDLAYSTDGGTTKHILVEDQVHTEQTIESVSFASYPRLLAVRNVAAGAKLYGRAQCSGSPTANFSMAAWALR